MYFLINSLLLLALLLLVLEGTNLTITHGSVVLCKHLRRQKNETHLWLNKRVRALNNSYSIVMRPAIRRDGKVPLQWLGNASVTIAVKPKYVRVLSRLVLHHCFKGQSETLDRGFRNLWRRLVSDPMKHVIFLGLSN